MRVIEEIDESIMIAEFLKAEIASPRWSQKIEQILKNQKVANSIVKHPNFSNVYENKQRKNILAQIRGYNQNMYLFSEFPDNASWKKVKIAKEELHTIRYMNWDYWIQTTNNTRSPKFLAKNIENNILIDTKTNAIKEIAKTMKNNFDYPLIIVVSNNLTSSCVLLEGHFRLTAMHLAYDYLPEEIDIIIGLSPNINSWKYF